MIVVTIRIIVHPDNRKEFLQTAKSLFDRIRNEKGCLSYRFYQDIENENAFIFVAEWETQADLDNHIRSDSFGVLLGAMNLLSEAPEIKFNAVSYTAGMEAVEAVRGKMTR